MDADDCNYFFIGTTGCCVVLREYNETKLSIVGIYLHRVYIQTIHEGVVSLTSHTCKHNIALN